jgi:serine/threonine protein kinase
MKVCPQCTTGFPDSHTTCPIHGGYLSEIVDLRPGMMIRNSYRILRKLGEGGMGSVYLAEQTLMEEQRALKFLSRQWGRDEGFTARFRREVRTLRQVRHKNVVDSGDLERAEDDTLFFAMEFVDGPDLRDFLSSAPRPFDVKLALEIARGIAEGLGAAHAKGMVHRDIKPENILMAREGDAWVPKIADFGIVATKENSTTRTRTGSGSLLTWAYAAPEQWRGMRSTELDGRTDLYALGGVLFEMLTGQTVFDADSYEGWAEQHKNTAPIAPSSVRPELANWQGLDELVMRLLAKDRDKRPKDVSEILHRLGDVHYGEPQRRRTVVEEPYTTIPAITPRPIPVASRPFAPKPLFKIAVPVPRTLQGHTLDVTSLSFSPDGRALASGSSDSTVMLWHVDRGLRLRTLHGHSRQVHSVAFGPDGRTLASGSFDHSIRLWDAENGKQLRALQEDVFLVQSVAFSPDGCILASGSGDKTIKLWNMNNEKEKHTLHGHGVTVLSVAFGPDGRTLASGSGDNTVKLWDAPSGRELRTLLGHEAWVSSVAVCPDGSTLASGSADKTVRIWNMVGGENLHTLRGHEDAVLSVAYSFDGRTLASAGGDRAVRLWDVASGQELCCLRGHSSEVLSVAFCPDGRILASGSKDKTIKLWDVTGLRK